MAKSFHKQFLGPSARPAPMDGESMPEKKAAAQRPSCTLYTDVSVCRVLGFRRRPTIADARTSKTRGTAWDCIGRHAGMSKDWVQNWALAHGVSPIALGALEEIKPDNVVSVKLVGTWPNYQKATCEVVATGEKIIVNVPDVRTMRLYDIFDARDFGSEVTWVAELNKVGNEVV